MTVEITSRFALQFGQRMMTALYATPHGTAKLAAMAVFATTTWARKAGLSTKGRDWDIRVHLLANGKHPTGVGSRRGTELFVILCPDLYWIDIMHGGKRSDWVVKRSGGLEQSRDRELDLPAPSLATFGSWVATAEAAIGKTFRRDKLWVQSNIKGGRDAIVTWVENGFRWG